MNTSESTQESSTTTNFICPHCTTLLPSRAVFCSTCGERIDQENSKDSQLQTNTENDAQEQEADTVVHRSFPPSKSSGVLSSQPFENTTVAEPDTVASLPLPQGIIAQDTAANLAVPKTLQPVPVTEVPKLPWAMTPRPTVSYIPAHNVAVYPFWSNIAWSTIIILSAIAAALFNSIFASTAARPAVEFWFLCICPGMIIVRLLQLKSSSVVKWALAIALSFTSIALVAGIQLYSGKWSPSVTLSILIAFSLIISSIQLIRNVATLGADKSYVVSRAVEELEEVRTQAISAILDFKPPEIILAVLPLLALFLWSISLQIVTLNDMNNLGLISALSPRIIVALGILVVSFAVTLQRKKVRVALLVFQLVCIIVIVYTTPHLIEEAPRFAPIYRSSGYTDYIMQTGTVNPQLDFYFNVPGFYVLSAIFTKVMGYSTILSYEGWAPLFFNLIYAGPMYIIFTSFTSNKRLVWLSLLFFYLTNWVGQDSFSPQGLNFFLYLVIIMILLKWFRMPPKKHIQAGNNTSFIQKISNWLKTSDKPSPAIQPRQQRGLVYCLILIFGLVVFSHPLTPFFTLLSVSLLIAFRRCYPFWLPILMIAMAGFWDTVVAGQYASQHFNLLASLGDLTGNVPNTITSGKLSGDALYHIIATMRLYTTVLLWFLALLGGLKRLRQGNKDITFILLAIAGFPMIVAQSYGGEMLLRIYFFTQPFMCFFAASLFFDTSMKVKQKTQHAYTFFSWRTASIITATLLLMSSFLFTRYGDERVNYISYGEWNAIQRLYQIAPTNALLLTAWDYTPLYYKDYTKYDIVTLSTAYPEAVANSNTKGIIDIIQNEGRHNSYIIFSQEEQVYATAYNGLPGDTLQRLETSLLQTGKFKIVYQNSDAQILQFVGSNGQWK